MVKRTGKNRQGNHAPLSRRAIAAHAARLMAVDGVNDIGAAKRKAARQLGFVQSDALPSNEDVETELRAYHRLFQANEHGARLAYMREVAMELMTVLTRHRPYLTGPVWDGTAARGAAIDIDLFTDSAKQLEISLIDAGVCYRTQESKHFFPAERRKIPLILLDYRDMAVRLKVFGENDLRGALARGSSGLAPRGDLLSVLRLCAETCETSASGQSSASSEKLAF